MELPIYIFSIPDLVDDAFISENQGTTLKTSLSQELEAELSGVERKLLNFDEVIQVTGGQASSELALLLKEAFEERSRQLSGTPAYQALLNRRARIALLEIRTHRNPEGNLQVELTPGHVVAVLEGETQSWFRMVLERHVADLYGKQGQSIHPHGLLLEAKHIPEYVPANDATSGSGRTPRDNDSRLNRTLQRFGAALLLVPVALVALILILFYTWVADVRHEYDDLKQTVNIQKDQIIKVVQDGLEHSTDVMDIIDVVRDVTLGKDSTKQE